MESKEVVRERVRRFRANKKKGELPTLEVGVECALPHQSIPVIVSRFERVEGLIDSLSERIAQLEAEEVVSKVIPGHGLRGADVRVDKADLFRRVMAEKEKRFGHG